MNGSGEFERLNGYGKAGEEGGRHRSIVGISWGV